MHKIKKIKYKIYEISVQKSVNAKGYTIIVINRRLFCVIMRDVQEGLGVKNISDLVRKEIHGIFEAKTPTKDPIGKHKRRQKELDNDSNSTFMYFRSDLMSRIIKNCRGEKGRVEKKIVRSKLGFRCQLGFRLHDITMSKEESVTTEIMKAFSNEKILPQHSVLIPPN